MAKYSRTYETQTEPPSVKRDLLYKQLGSETPEMDFIKENGTEKQRNEKEDKV